jgi:hypothetical protein
VSGRFVSENAAKREIVTEKFLPRPTSLTTLCVGGGNATDRSAKSLATLV